MTPQVPSDPRPSSYSNAGPSLIPPADRGEVDFSEWLGSLWDGRRLIAATLGLFIALGLFMAWRSIPMFQAEAMLQVQAKKASSSSDPAFSKMEGLFSEPVDAQAEIEILKSSQVLGRAVEALKLDLIAEPKYFPVIGRMLAKGNPEAPRIEVESLDVPALLRGQRFRLTALGGDTFRWEALRPSLLGSSPAFMGNGKVGEPVSGTFAGETATLTVRTLFGKPGQQFIVVRQPFVDAIADLRLVFEASEKGKLTNVLGLTLKDASPTKAAAMLNAIVDAYVHQGVERKAAEIAKTQSALEAKLPDLKAKVDASETRLNQFRARSGSVDLSREADVFLQQSSNLNGQITALRQKKEDLLRTYRETSDVVMTLNQQIEKLQGEASHVDQKMRTLPGLQQEVVRLTRDVQVNTELYTALLNNIQQLQVAKDSDIGSVTVVDTAAPPAEPTGPKKSMQIALFAFLGLLVGVGLTMLQKAFRRGVEDHHLIEAKLGIPVIVTIPHSAVQDSYHEEGAVDGEGNHLLSVLNPNDLAVESLRSLRTSLHFAMKDARNKVVMLTGPSPSVGKSFISSNLAAVLAQAGAKVLVVDADLRRGNLHAHFGLKSREDGFSEILAGRREWKHHVKESDVKGLDLVTSGSIPPNPSELLLDPRLPEFLTQASEVYDFVIVDAPPVLPVTDATILGAFAGTVLMVARYGQHPLDELRACQRRLGDHRIRIHGCIFNDLKPSGLGEGSYKYAYHYSYK